MIVELTATTAVVTEADDCARLHVSTALAHAEIDQALRTAGLGYLDGSAARLDLGVLRARAREAATTGDWDSRWQAMVDYASGKGWLADDGSTVEAHIEFQPAAT